MIKKSLMLCICLSIFLISCDLKNKSELQNRVEMSSELSYFPVMTYGVYSLYVNNSNENEFDQLMLNNPIDEKMEADIQNTDVSNTRSSQVFFDGYVEMWKYELNFSIDNLKQYLNKDEIEELEEAQKNWECNIELNNQIDQKIMAYNDINLGTQYVSSALLYLINEYRERVFHIKYMTMLAEECVPTQIPESQRTWNKFIVD